MVIIVLKKIFYIRNELNKQLNHTMPFFPFINPFLSIFVVTVH